MSDARELPSASVDDVMGWKPCWIRVWGYDLARKKVEFLWAGRDRVTLREALDLPIKLSEVVWLLDWMTDLPSNRDLWRMTLNRAYAKWSATPADSFDKYILAEFAITIESIYGPAVQLAPTP